MITNHEKKLKFRIRFILVGFIIALILSGVTAFPIETELTFAIDNLTLFPGFVRNWLSTVFDAVKTTNSNYPFISYGTDWLAFAHIVIAVAFIGPLKNPVRNIWVIQFGMIACCMVLPLAFIAGSVRGIPFYWQLIDCSFGVFGFIPLYLCYKYTRKLESCQIQKNVG